MRILVVEDDPRVGEILTDALALEGYTAVVAGSGQEGVDRSVDPEVGLAILDVMLPDIDGFDVLRRLRARRPDLPVLMLTARDDLPSKVAGLEAGADDYLTKPFDPPELRERLRVGCRIIDLQSRLADRVAELEIALANVKQLQGLLPICAYCKSIRDDHNYWQRVESYLADHADVRFTHGICPNCLEQEMKSFSAVKSAAG